MKKASSIVLILALTMSFLNGCTNAPQNQSNSNEETSISEAVNTETLDYSYINAERFLLILDPNVEVSSDFVETINLLMDLIEKETHLSFTDALNLENIDSSSFPDENINSSKGDISKIKIYLTSKRDEQVKATTTSSGITIYAPYFDTQNYGVSILTHELTHLIIFRNSRLESLVMLEGIAEFYGDKICRELSSFPIFYESYEYGTGVIKENVTPFNARELFESDFKDNINKRACYQYGTALVTYLYETFGDTWLIDLISNLDTSEVSRANSIADALAATLDEKLFEKFSVWYEDNSDRFKYKEIEESDLLLYNY